MTFYKQQILEANINILTKALVHLDFSYSKCIAIKSEQFTTDELEHLEAFASRFSRVVDIYIKKVVRTILEIIKESQPTFLDAMHLCEKIGIIKSTEIIDRSRDLRNEIVHEYIDEDLLKLYQDMLAITPSLLSNIDNTFHYIKSNLR